MSTDLGDLDGRLAAMIGEMEAADAIYQPSAMWTNLGALNRRQLERGGLDHFKRSVNQNYFNWLPQSLSDNQVRRVLRQWLRRPSLRPLLARMAPLGALEGFAHDRPLDDRVSRLVYKLYVALLWDVARREDRAGLIDDLAEPLEGDPIRIRYRGRFVSQDLANSVREANRVLEHIAPAAGQTPIVAELGAGYGRLGHPLLANRRCRYWVFDIPPALSIAEWYLPRVVPGRRVFPFRPFARYADVRAELESSEIAFFTANQIALLPDDAVDAFVNISSLHEMRSAQIDHYLLQMARTCRQAIYLKQWRSFTNTDDGTIVTRESYRLPGPWRVVRDAPDAVQDLFFELVALRQVQ